MGTIARRGICGWFGLIAAVLVAGCGSSASSTSGLTGGGDGAQCTPDPNPIDPQCVLCEPQANAPEITGRLIVAGTESVPSPSGGDPTGVWVGTDVIVQVPESAGGFVDVNASSFHGSGWLMLQPDGTFEFLIEGEASVVLNGSTTPIVRGASGGAKGVYSVSGSTLGFSPECQFSDDPEIANSDGGIRLDSNPFSVSGSRMTLQVQMTVSGIAVDIILQLDAA